VANAIPKRVAAKWIRGRADELAVAAGMRFDSSRGEFVCQWIEANCYLFEGRNEPVKLLAWHRDVIMRLFSWVKYSEFHGRWIRRYKHVTVWAAKKNAKSPLIAFLGLYMLYGDSEHGAKICIGATKLDQAALSQKHAVKTVEKSPALAAVCTINKTTKAIICESRDSVMLPIASDNKGAEGLNANMLCVDELAVIDQAFAEVLHGMTISRVEPITLRISTAGNDPESYGYQEYIQGKQDEASQTPPLDRLFIDYSAPQNLTSEELSNNFEKYARMSNPAYGDIINPEEIRADYEASKTNPVKFASFKRYRLGIWQFQAGDPLISPEDWQACQWKESPRSFLRTHRKQPCFLALDFSQINDFTVGCFAFQMPDDWIDLFFRVFMPIRTIERYAKRKQEFQTWYDDGHILKGGIEVIEQDLVQRELVRVASKVYTREIIFDPTFAPQNVQQLARGLQDYHGNLIVPGIGGRLIEFRQTADVMTRPIDDFQSLAVSHKIRVYPNPCVDWQIGNMQAKEDAYGKKRIEKPEGWRKIDAGCSAIMAVTRAIRGAPKPSISFI
jgi:phage terminase large subunit-like protein